MRAVVCLLALAACGGSGPSTQPPQALVFTAPAQADHPAYQVQMLVGAAQLDRIAPQQLFVAIASALHPALITCGVTSDSAPSFLLEGELRLDSIEGSSLHSSAAVGEARCVVDALSQPLDLPAEVDARLPFAMVLIQT